MIGVVRQVAASKNNFLPFKGKLLLALFSLISVLVRLFAILLYFAPSLGLMNLLRHWTMGQKNRTDSKLFDAINGNQKQFEDIWEPTPEYTHYTVYSLKEYFIAFIIFFAVHPFLIFAVKKKFSGGFETTRNFYEKIHHIVTQLYVPSTFKDWDEYEITSELFSIV